MINGSLGGILIGIIALETLSQFCARKYYEDNTKVWLFVAGWFLYLSVLLLLVKAYDYTGFAMANALWDSGTIISMAVIGYFYFKEKFNTGELIGLGLVVTGAILLGVYSQDKNTQ